MQIFLAGLAYLSVECIGPWTFFVSRKSLRSQFWTDKALLRQVDFHWYFYPNAS